MNLLRDYQIECINTIHSHFKTSDKQLIQLPTGAGKTWIFLNYLRQHSKSALIICPSIELKEQIVEAGKFFLGRNAISFGIGKEPFNVTTSASLRNVKIRDWDTIVVDEAHHAPSNSYKDFIDKLEGKKLLGCTATPERYDGKSLLDIFGQLTFQRNIINLIESKHLCDIQGYRIKTGIKINSHKSKGHDFSQVQLNELDTDSRNEMIISSFMDNCTQLKTLIFCLGINHAQKIAKALCIKGIKAEAIHGKMTFSERKKILERFKSGKTMALTNCQLLTEGFDEPSIESLMIARPTKSKVLYCQMIGRGLRNYPGKQSCKLFELTDNAFKICTFNVVADLPTQKDFEYSNGISLTLLKKEIDKLNIQDLDYELQKEKMNLFHDHNFWDGPAFATQHIDLSYDCSELTFKEAAFLLWKERLKRKYGYN